MCAIPAYSLSVIVWNIFGEFELKTRLEVLEDKAKKFLFNDRFHEFAFGCESVIFCHSTGCDTSMRRAGGVFLSRSSSSDRNSFNLMLGNDTLLKFSEFLQYTKHVAKRVSLP